jgi:leucyl aminopeptidase (aminopeptidase T)
MHAKVCDVCNRDFVSRYITARYCSPVCRRVRAREADLRSYHKNREKRLETTRAYEKVNAEKAAARKRAWHAQNPDARREWKEAHADQEAARKKAWAAANREKVREQQRRWREANPDYGKKYRESRPKTA